MQADLERNKFLLGVSRNDPVATFSVNLSKDIFPYVLSHGYHSDLCAVYTAPQQEGESQALCRTDTSA